MSSAESTAGWRTMRRDISYRTGVAVAVAIVLAALSLLFIDWLLRAETLPSWVPRALHARNGPVAPLEPVSS